MKLKFIIYIILFVLMQACELLIPCKDTDFSIAREKNNSQKLNLAGYYYGNLFGEDTSSVNVYLLYQNGVIFDAHSKKTNDAVSGNISFNLNKLVFEHKSSWGIYKITNDSIEIQEWFPENNGCVKVLVLKGTILNDTTFSITHWHTFDRHWIKKNVDTINAVFKFHKYSPKPDSTNIFFP